jgi:hypothetical protein
MNLQVLQISEVVSHKFNMGCALRIQDHRYDKTE